MNTASHIDVSLQNRDLWDGAQIENVAGRLNLVTPPAEAAQILGNNLSKMQFDRDKVVLSGPMAIWAYLIVFHAVVHRTKKVVYDDGRGNEILVAAHG